MFTPSKSEAGIGGIGGGLCDGICGIRLGNCASRAKNVRAVIHRPWRSSVVAVNFSARSGVKIKIDRPHAVASSGFFGSGVRSCTSSTDWMATAVCQ